MKLSWYGTAAVMLESEGTRIAFDPFLGMRFNESPAKRRIRESAFLSADAVFVTHGHFDHIRDIPSLYAGTDIPIYATATPCDTLKRLGIRENRLRLIAPSDVIETGPFRITVYQGRHCRFDFGVVMKTVFKGATLRHPKRLIELLILNKAFPENGETLLYEIEAEGKRLQLTGSMGMDPDTAYQARADVLILPFQGTGSPAVTAAPIIGRLKPKSVYLDHHDDSFPPMSAQISTASFVGRLNAHNIPCEALAEGREYII